MLKPAERLALINQALRRLGHRTDPFATQARRLLRAVLALPISPRATPQRKAQLQTIRSILAKYTAPADRRTQNYNP